MKTTIHWHEDLFNEVAACGAGVKDDGILILTQLLNDVNCDVCRTKMGAAA